MSLSEEMVVKDWHKRTHGEVGTGWVREFGTKSICESETEKKHPAHWVLDRSYGKNAQLELDLNRIYLAANIGEASPASGYRTG